MDEWKALYDSKSGERGIFSRVSATKQASRNGRRDPDWEFGTNPCSEIILRNKQFCNLSEIVVRSTDTIESLRTKARLASILGTLQSTLINFKYLTNAWRKNTAEERLLGVSLTGIMDSNIMNGKGSSNIPLPEILEELREITIATNAEWAKKLGIPQSTAVTCVKPSGTVSQLVDAASGIHARHNPHYIRTVRSDKKDPISQLMVDLGFPAEDDVMRPDHTIVFSFPMKTGEGSVYRNDMTALEQLELWLTYQKHWCEHKPSVTVSVKEDEWFSVGAWVYDNFDYMSGVSFLPFSDHIYKQAPYQDCNEEEYNQLVDKMPKNADWSKLSEYESTDQTEGAQLLACVAGVCEI
jgi:ribonucleoside-diphosphate reductase alpha chain